MFNRVVVCTRKKGQFKTTILNLHKSPKPQKMAEKRNFENFDAISKRSKIAKYFING